MTDGSRYIAMQPDDDFWPGLPVYGTGAVARARSERWLLRTDDGREVELLRREVTILYRAQSASSFRLTSGKARWSLGLAGLIAATIVIAAGVMTPNRSVAASAIIDIPKPVPVAEPLPHVVVRTRYIVARPSQSAKIESATMTDPGGARDVPTALRRAFATNEAQNWVTADASGIVVVGAVQIKSGRHCRDVAILTRAAEGDSTVNERYCQTRSGPITLASASDD